MTGLLEQAFDASIVAHKDAFDKTIVTYKNDLIALGGQLADTLDIGKKVLVCGNGGSACDALHFAGELVGRFAKDRPSLPAIALTADSGILTAVGNDYGFEYVFSRQIEGLGSSGDMLIAISTSGRSANVLRAIEVANSKQLNTILLTGAKCNKSTLANTTIAVPCAITAHIQEIHIYILQLLVLLCEKKLYPEL